MCSSRCGSRPRFVHRGGTWFLRVRVVPDAISTHQPPTTSLSKVELDAIEEVWRQTGSDDLESIGSAERCGAGLVPRWSARNRPPGRPATLPTGDALDQRRDHRGNALLCCGPTWNRPRTNASPPPTMELWLARGGQPAQLAVTLTPIEAEVQVDLDDSTTTSAPWWTSSHRSGPAWIAAEINLGTVADDIDTLYLVGIGGPDPGGPAGRTGRQRTPRR
ncbi:MAG: hypothetical protein WKF76_10350 [Nocardioidaceae bacterium]